MTSLSPRTTALVIGGKGHLGGHILAALQRLPQLVVTLSTRHPTSPAQVRLDLDDPTTFPAIDAFDVIVDASDSLLASPDDLIAYCLQKPGKTYMCTSADPETVERLIDRFGAHPGPGTLLLGAGIHTGLSNLLAAHVLRSLDAPHPDRCAVHLGLRLSPLSSAGQGMVRLLPHTLTAPTLTYRNGTRRVLDTFEPGPRFTFQSARRSSLKRPLAEAVMVHRSLGARDITTSLSVSPRPLQYMLRYAPAILLKNKAFSTFLLFLFTLLRRVLFAWRPDPVALSVVAHDHTLGITREGQLHAHDGSALAGACVAAIIDLLPTRQDAMRRGGLALIDERFALTEILAWMRRDGALRFGHSLPPLP